MLAGRRRPADVMADFFQTGAVATLHRLGPSNLDWMERGLEVFAQKPPLTRVRPCRMRERGAHALRPIRRELCGGRHLQPISVGLDGAARARDWRKARKVFSQLPQQTALLWNDGPRMKGLFQTLEDAQLHAGEDGQGRAVWTYFGCVPASEHVRRVAAHDGDILSSSRDLLARRCCPMARLSLGFDFRKGYSARVASRLHGRGLRWLVTPLVRALTSILGAHRPYWVYGDTFRYLLAGECCLDADLVRRVRIPQDWAVESGLRAGGVRQLDAGGFDTWLGAFKRLGRGAAPLFRVGCGGPWPLRCQVRGRIRRRHLRLQHPSRRRLGAASPAQVLAHPDLEPRALGVGDGSGRVQRGAVRWTTPEATLAASASMRSPAACTDGARTARRAHRFAGSRRPTCRCPVAP
jgi:hypothetical protein